MTKADQPRAGAPQAAVSRFAINRHFRREALMMIGFVVALLFLALVASMIGPWVISYLEDLR